MLKTCFKLKAIQWLTGIFSVLIATSSFGQTSFMFQNLDDFENPGETWAVAGNVQADLNEAGLMTSTKGTGILVNIPTKKNKGKDLYTRESFGDMDLEVEYLVAKGSNSGIYLQGMYEIQILDSWGVAIPRAGDNGGIYERWDESKPDGEKGYQGYAPRQNPSKAPGLWQKLEVSFQAPQFDEQGNKTQNARMISVSLNGVTIHEDVELFGPTRGAMEDQEMAVGPLRIQGDHGAVAFRNLVITPFDSQTPQLKDIGYEVYQGRFENEPDFTQLEPYQSGKQEVLSSNIRTGSGQFLIHYKGILETFKEGDYDLGMLTSGGSGLLRMDGKDVLPMEPGRKSGNVHLTQGNHEFEIVYAKIQDWAAPGLSLTIAGPGLRETELTNINTTFNGPTDPILVDPRERPVLRSFMDLPEQPRITHAVSVGSEDNVHYTYDMDNGNLIQVWRGEFLNATPMWNSRGDGSSRPLGAVTRFGKPSFSIAQLSGPNAPWIADSTGTHFNPKGYKIKSEDHHLAFIYKAFGATVEDDLEILDNGQGIKRTIGIIDDQEGLYLRLAVDGMIEDLGEGLYLIGDKDYYVKIDSSGSAEPMLRNSMGERELLVPVAGKIVYSLLF
ncbi:MAG: DUF1080 domain-containing protein [Cyclobacteriaceae bacterium]